jgi:hypothetical protein
MTILVISSFNVMKHYKLYGHEFMKGLSELQNVTMACITVDDKHNMPHKIYKNISITQLSDAELDAFYEKYPKGKVKNYRKDGIRFAPKAFTIARAIQELSESYDYIIWLDADVKINKDWDDDFFENVLPKDEMVSALQRSKKHSETGFLAFNCKHKDLQAFANTYINLWTSMELLNFPEQHDAYLFDVAIKKVQAPVRNLNKLNDHVHPFNYSYLGKYMDHLKGKRKKSGESPEQYKG